MEIARSDESYGIVAGLWIGIKGRLGYLYRWITQPESLTIGEFHGKSARHCSHIMPRNLDFCGVEWRKERLYGLKHGERCQLIDGRSVVASGGIWVINRNDIAVSLHGVHVAAAVSMGITARMAVFA